MEQEAKRPRVILKRGNSNGGRVADNENDQVPASGKSISAHHTNGSSTREGQSGARAEKGQNEKGHLLEKPAKPEFAVNAASACRETAARQEKVASRERAKESSEWPSGREQARDVESESRRGREQTRQKRITEGSVASPCLRSQPQRATEPKPDAAATGSLVADVTPVSFDVGGSMFKVSAKLIKARSSTKLAKVLKATDNQGPIFVDSSPDRFPYILDWYRDGEINVPKNVSIPALLMDAKYLELPREIIINGSPRFTGPGMARSVSRNLVSSVVRRWEGFDAFLDKVVDDINRHFAQLGVMSNSKAADSSSKGLDGFGAEEEENYDFVPYYIPLFGEEGWVDAQNVCSAARARVLALKLEDLGFVCDFTETEIIVSLPTRLKNEYMETPYEQDDAYYEDAENEHFQEDADATAVN